MDADNCALACGLVSRAYIGQGQAALGARRRQVKALLSSRRLPPRGWDEATIEMLLQDAAAMDSNNFPENVGVGEREARVGCPLVARRHYRLAHGIGRSGDLTAEQPKAAGSSLLAKLAVLLAGDALAAAGLPEVGAVTILPSATGMALTLTLLAAKAARPSEARHVIWSRIDQKTCLKAITAAGLVPEVIQLRRDGEQLITDVDGIAAAIASLGADRVAAVITTTSCFAPRAADDVVAVGKLCDAAGVPHIVNNAYGVQAAGICAQLTSAMRKGRVDAVVQSTDKNFMVPVGGAIVAAPKSRPALVAAVNANYPGRASMSAHLDLLVTLLYWGAEGWRARLQERERLFGYLRDRLACAAAHVGGQLLHTPGNPISLALSLEGLQDGGTGEGTSGKGTGSSADGGDLCAGADGGNATASGSIVGAGSGCEAAAAATTVAGSHAAGSDAAGSDVAAAKDADARRASATFFGSMLWARCISGTRVVARGAKQTVAGIPFVGYGSHCDDYGCDYLTAAAAIGTTEAEVDEFVSRLCKCFDEFKKRMSLNSKRGDAKGGSAKGGRGKAGIGSVAYDGSGK